MNISCLFNASEKEKQMSLATAFITRHGISMGHFKATCPNANSGEKAHHYPIEGLMIDLTTKTGLWMTRSEIDTMNQFGADNIMTLNFEELTANIADLIYKYRGTAPAKKYSL